jgi:hypothetical protein
MCFKVAFHFAILLNETYKQVETSPVTNMASRRTLLIGAAALIAADGAQAFAPSSLRAFGAAKAQLPAVWPVPF